jgi:hypothetical protein
MSQPEPSYTYKLVRPSTAQVIATNEFGDPLITRNTIGKGEVLLSTPVYLQPNSRDQLLRVGAQLLDSLIARNSPARVTGPPVEYIVNQGSDKTVVTLINNAGVEWAGAISVQRPLGVPEVREYITDQAVRFTMTASDLTVAGRVPAYSVRVFAIEKPISAAASRSSRPGAAAIGRSR